MSQRKSDWKDRAEALIEAVQDVAPPGHPPRGSDAGSARHEALFEDYVRSLSKHKKEAERWWRALIDSEEKNTGERDQAISNATERRPLGALSHPYVAGDVRRCWLACVALNDETAPSKRIAPEELTLGWLVRKGHDDLAEFLAGYPFWPIGLNFAGDWV